MLPCATTPVQQATNWWPIVIGGIQFLLGTVLAVYTFRKNFQQKADDRRASWYHKVVVDKAIALLAEYMHDERHSLEEALLQCEFAFLDVDLSALRKEEPFKNAASEFERRLRRVRGELTNLALIFDRSLFDRVQANILSYEDRVSVWFYDARSTGTIRTTLTVTSLLSDFHRDILSTLREYEFKTLSRSRPE